MYITPTSNDSALYNESWLAESTALAQRALVLDQLKRPNKTQPFYHFIQLLAVLAYHEPRVEAGKPLTLLDAGCGVGHYGVLLRQLAPRVLYTGTDLSQAMLDNTILENGVFIQRPFEQNEFGLYDVVLLSQVLEMTDSPRAALFDVLRAMREGGWLLMHRLRHDDIGARAVLEATYGGLPARNYIWDMAELRLDLEAWGAVCKVHGWGDSATASLLFQKCSM